MVGVIEDMMLDERQNHFAHLRARIARAVNNGPPPIIPPRVGGTIRRAGQIHVGFIPPTMDFEMVGFDLGLGAGPVGPPPTYDKPETAPDGFTRSPSEEDAIICPNCKEELCLGGSDLKKQVWIVKACGHVRLFYSLSLRISVLISMFRFTVANAQQTGAPRRVPKEKNGPLPHALSPSRSVLSMAARRRRPLRNP